MFVYDTIMCLYMLYIQTHINDMHTHLNPKSKYVNIRMRVYNQPGRKGDTAAIICVYVRIYVYIRIYVYVYVCNQGGREIRRQT